MSLSQKLSTLDEGKKEKIEELLQKKYPNSFEVRVLFSPGFLEWMESQPWESIKDASVMHSVRNTFTLMLQDKNVCSEKPFEILNNLFEMYHFVKKNLANQIMVDSEAGSSSDPAAHTSNNTNVTEDQSFDFHKNLESLEVLIKQNDDHIRIIERKLKELEQLMFSQTYLTTEMEKLKITNNNFLTLQDKNHKISEITKKSNENQNEIMQRNKAIIASLKSLFENISDLVFTKNKDFQDRILSKISDWNYNKQQAQVGWPVYSYWDFLQPLTPVCDRFARILLSTHRQTVKLVDVLTKIGRNNENLKVEQMKNESKRMLIAFLKRCFVVEKQPPPTFTESKVFSVSLRLLLGSQFLSSGLTPTVTCSLHLDDDIRRFYRANFENVKAQDENIQKVTNNKKALTYNKETDSFCVSFDKLKLNKLEKRKTKLDEDKKLVSGQKSCLMFQTQIRNGTESFTIEAFSVPIVVMTNTSQCMESEATIFWDNAFGSKNREPFVVPDRVPLHDFLEALNQKWATCNERELEQCHLNFLARKLFPDTAIEELSRCYVTKQKFNEEHIKGGYEFTFWSWFYKTMKLVKDFLIKEWQDNKIYGFIDKSESESKLNECLVGTFLLRFSDSKPGGISIAYKENMQVPGCNHVRPWMKDELKQKSFSDSLRDLQYHSELKCLQYLYPSIPKDDAFEMYYSKTDENNSEGFDPRYPKKAPIRVVRHDDSGSTSASNFSSNQSTSFQNTSPPSLVGRMSESTNGNEHVFSPQSLEHDPLLSQGSLNDLWDPTQRMEEEDDILGVLHAY